MGFDVFQSTLNFDELNQVKKIKSCIKWSADQCLPRVSESVHFSVPLCLAVDHLFCVGSCVWLVHLSSLVSLGFGSCVLRDKAELDICFVPLQLSFVYNSLGFVCLVSL